MCREYPIRNRGDGRTVVQHQVVRLDSATKVKCFETEELHVLVIREIKAAPRKLGIGWSVDPQPDIVAHSFGGGI
jgi:hypothetical protein